MRCTDWKLRGSLAGLTLMAGCSAPAPPSPALAPSPAPSATGERPAAATPSPAAPATAAAAGPVKLPPPGPVHSMAEVRLQAAKRLVAAHPSSTYMGKVPDQLLAIPVLEIELNADGSVRRITALRLPRQAKDTTQLAIDAIHRAGPYGNVSRLPKPWRFVETFLFDDDRKFKPRTLD